MDGGYSGGFHGISIFHFLVLCQRFLCVFFFFFWRWRPPPLSRCWQASINPTVCRGPPPRIVFSPRLSQPLPHLVHRPPTPPPPLRLEFSVLDTLVLLFRFSPLITYLGFFFQKNMAFFAVTLSSFSSASGVPFSIPLQVGLLFPSPAANPSVFHQSAPLLVEVFF